MGKMIIIQFFFIKVNMMGFIYLEDNSNDEVLKLMRRFMTWVVMEKYFRGRMIMRQILVQLRVLGVGIVTGWVKGRGVYFLFLFLLFIVVFYFVLFFYEDKKNYFYFIFVKVLFFIDILFFIIFCIIFIYCQRNFLQIRFFVCKLILINLLFILLIIFVK